MTLMPPASFVREHLDRIERSASLGKPRGSAPFCGSSSRSTCASRVTTSTTISRRWGRSAISKGINGCCCWRAIPIGTSPRWRRSGRSLGTRVNDENLGALIRRLSSPSRCCSARLTSRSWASHRSSPTGRRRVSLAATASSASPRRAPRIRSRSAARR
jgi:hypothetical protein